MRNFEKLIFSRKIIFLVVATLFMLVTVPSLLHYHTSVDGGYTNWSPWSECFAACGPSVQGRTRNCTNPRPVGYGRHCTVIGPYVETRPCELKKCAINGNWGHWGNWTTCVPFCKDGRQSRSRVCDNPPPSDGGSDCANKETLSKEERQCTLVIPCPIDGGLSEWESWTVCSMSCGTGTRERQRHCNNPVPKYKGKNCVGHTHDIDECVERPCTTNKPNSTQT